MANDVISPLKKGTGSEPNRPGAGETTAPPGACTLFPTNGVPAAEIQGRVAWASRPRSCDPPATPPAPGWPPHKTPSRDEERTRRGGFPFLTQG